MNEFETLIILKYGEPQGSWDWNQTLPHDLRIQIGEYLRYERLRGSLFDIKKSTDETAVYRPHIRAGIIDIMKAYESRT